MAPDGKTIAAAVREPMGGTSVNFYPMGSVEARARLGGFDVVAFSPNGAMLATSGEANVGTIHLYDLASGAKRDLPGHQGTTHCAVFHPGGSVLATGGADAKIRLWSMTTGSEIVALDGQEGPVLALAFSPNGRVLASGGSDKTLRLWTMGAAK